MSWAQSMRSECRRLAMTIRASASATAAMSAKSTRVGLARQVQVDHAEGVAALGDRHEDALAAALVDPHDLLAAQHLLVDRAAQGDDRDLAVLLLHPGRVRTGAGEAHDGPVRDVGDEELDVRGSGEGGQAVGHHVDGLDR